MGQKCALVIKFKDLSAYIQYVRESIDRNRSKNDLVMLYNGDFVHIHFQEYDELAVRIPQTSMATVSNVADFKATHVYSQ